MKNYFPFLFFLLIIISVESSGQKGTYITPVGMVQRTMIFNKQEQQYKGIHKNIASYGATYGISIFHSFTSRVGIEYSLLGSKQVQRYKIYHYAGGPLYGEGSKRLVYIKIPVLFRGELIAKKNNKLFFTIGPQVSILLSEDGGVPIYQGYKIGVPSDTLSSYDPQESGGAYHSLTLDAVGSIGWELKLYRDVYFRTQFRVDYSLTDVENKSYSIMYSYGNVVAQNAYYLFSKDRPPTHNISLGLLFGLSFKIR
jgi:hypothetical protein